MVVSEVVRASARLRSGTVRFCHESLGGHEFEWDSPLVSRMFEGAASAVCVSRIFRRVPCDARLLESGGIGRLAVDGGDEDVFKGWGDATGFDSFECREFGARFEKDMEPCAGEGNIGYLRVVAKSLASLAEIGAAQLITGF